MSVTARRAPDALGLAANDVLHWAMPLATKLTAAAFAEDRNATIAELEDAFCHWPKVTLRVALIQGFASPTAAAAPADPTTPAPGPSTAEQIRHYAGVVGMTARKFYVELLIVRADIEADVRDRALQAALALWRQMLADMGALERLAPNCANAGFLRHAELLDQIDALRARQAAGQPAQDRAA